MNIGIFYARYPKGDTQYRGVLYVDHPQWRNYPHELLEALQQVAGAGKAVVLCHEETYEGNNVFSEYWQPDTRNKGYFRRIEERINIDVILDKGYFRQQATFAMVNVPGLALLGRNKINQYQLFSELMPQTFFAYSEAQLKTAVEKLPGDLAVVKPHNLNGGRGVVIASKHTILKTNASLPRDGLLVQQFIDSSVGIPGMSQGVHDLRLYIINGEAVLASIRKPKTGSLVANTNQGGSIAFYDVAAIPAEPQGLAQKVDQALRQFGNRYYSVDFVKDDQRWYVLEINDRPGIPARFQSLAVSAFHKQLAACIAGAATNPLNKLGASV